MTIRIANDEHGGTLAADLLDKAPETFTVLPAAEEQAPVGATKLRQVEVYVHD